MLCALGALRDTVPCVRRTVTKYFVSGLCMGAADLVPGVSGGTVALLFGVYENLLKQISKIFTILTLLARFNFKSARKELRNVDWQFLCSLGIGIGIAVVTLAAWLSNQIEDHPVQLSAIFFGLIVGSVLLTKREIKTWDWARALWFILGAVAAFVVVGYSSESVSDPSSIIVISAGAVAICAMILPGISGSFILLAFGFYDHLLGAVKDFNVPVLLNYGIGAGIGLALFARGLSWLLRVHREKTLALLIGLMAGSLRVLWPWPSGDIGLENAALGRPVTSEVLGAATLSIIALAAVFILTTISRRFE